MADVYRGSTCNIGASASRSAYEGCFRARDARTVSPLVIKTSYTDASLPNAEYLVEGMHYEQSVHERKQPLFSRGWVFQELMLAPRTVHFASEYAFWECETSICSEKYPNGHPNSESRWRSFPTQPAQPLEGHDEDTLEFWAFVVHKYSPLRLTYSADRLVAISGVAQCMQMAIPSGKYLAGLVSCFLYINLLGPSIN